MTQHASRSIDLPLPEDSPRSVRGAFVGAVGLAHSAITFARSWAVNSRLGRVRLAAECDRLRAEVALLNRGLDLLRARFERVPPRNRPMNLEPMRSEIAVYVNWYNSCRPHTTLRGRTPLEVADALAPARDGPRFESRFAVKVEAHDLRAEPGAELECVVDFQQGQRHLPVVTLREAA